jgi:ParB family chromosome partitioning protein
MNSGLHFDYDISKIQGADYNPRKIDEFAIEKLKKSLSIIGCAKPIIVRGSVIVAGHQRTRALRASGIKTAPVYVLPSEANIYDEVRFNQLHNGTDMDLGDERAQVLESLEGKSGFANIDPEHLKVNTKSSGANIRHEIMSLILKYGPWGARVANEKGEIFHAAQYAIACKILSKPCLVYVVKNEIEGQARELLGATYGVFSYEKLPRNTYIQTFAQMYRLRNGKRENLSPTYQTHLLPWLNKNKSAKVLDFGCGQGDYVKMLADSGFHIQGVEFFRRLKDQDAIDVSAVNKMIDELIDSINNHGRFDAVICDYVLNSVDSQQAEDDVLTCVAAFCKPGGLVFLSGRTKERIEWQDTMKSHISTNKTTNRYVEFLDENGISALYRKGQWFYQKFHSENDIENFCKKHGFQIKNKTEGTTSFQLTAINNGILDLQKAEESLSREFNLPLNKSGRKLNRHEDIKKTILCLL